MKKMLNRYKSKFQFVGQINNALQIEILIHNDYNIQFILCNFY